MKKALSLVLAVMMLLGCMSISAFAEGTPAVLTGFDGGDGSAENPYQIATKAQFENLAAIASSDNNYCADTCFVLTADIGTTEAPVTAMINFWKGTFDGACHTITINITTGSLFGMNYDYGTIKNLITAGSVSGEGDSFCIGGVCGTNYGTIINCINTATVTGSIVEEPYGCALGGVCGNNYGTIINCGNTAEVTGNLSDFEDEVFSGGISGRNRSGQIINCFNTAEIEGSDWKSSGVCGYDEETIVNCYFDKTVKTYNNTHDPSTGLPASQMQAISGSAAGEDWVEIGGSKKPLIDLLNDYVEENSEIGLNKWEIASDGTFMITASSDSSTQSGDTTIKATVADFSYEMVIPTDIDELTEEKYTGVEVGAAYVQNVKHASANTVIVYTAECGDFIKDDDASVTMAAVYTTDEAGETAFPEDAVAVYANNADVDPLTTMYVSVEEDVWDAAPAGNYTATVTFNFAVEEAE